MQLDNESRAVPVVLSTRVYYRNVAGGQTLAGKGIPRGLVGKFGSSMYFGQAKLAGYCPG
jgi:hypothetical protein